MPSLHSSVLRATAFMSLAQTNPSSMLMPCNRQNMRFTVAMACGAFLPRSFANSFFLVGFAAVYLLLPLHVDQTETDDVYFDREDRRRVLGIPGAELETTENAADEAPAQE